MELIHLSKELDYLEISEIKNKYKLETLCCDDDLTIVNTRGSKRDSKEEDDFAIGESCSYEHMVVCNKCNKVYLIRYKYSASRKADYIDHIRFSPLDMTIKEIYEYFKSRTSKSDNLLFIDSCDFDLCIKACGKDYEGTYVNYIAFNNDFLAQAR